MALSGSFILNRTSGTEYLQGRVEWSATQNPTANTFTVRARLIFRRTNTGYTTYGTGNFTLAIGNNLWQTGQVSYSFTSSDTVMLDQTVTLPAASNGSLSVWFEGTYNGNTPISGNGAQTFALTPIDRAAPTVSLTVSKITDSTLQFVAITNYSCNSWSYSLNGGQSWINFNNSSTTKVTGNVTGLSPGSSYSLAVRAVRTYNGVSGTSKTISIQTLGSATISSVSDLQIDSSNPIINTRWNIYNTGYNYTFDVLDGNTILLSFENITSDIGIVNKSFTLSQEQINFIMNYMSSLQSIDVTYKLTTYSESEQIGNPSTVTGKIYTSSENSSPSFSETPIFSYSDSNENVVNVTGNNQVLVQNQSNLLVQIVEATPKNGATISQYSVSINDVIKTNSSNEISYGTISSSGNVTIVVTATDSRGYTCSYSSVISVISYQPIQISDYLFSRVNNYETYCNLSISGTFSPINVSGIPKNSLQSLKYRKMQNGGSWSEYIELSANISGSTFSYDSNNFENLDQAYEWALEFVASDKFSSDIITVSIGKGIPTVSLRDGKVGVNNPNPEYALDVSGDINTNGNLNLNGIPMLDFIVEQGTSGIWTYRKWNSGIAECWGRYSKLCTNFNAWGSLYMSVAGAFMSDGVDYPFSFIEKPIISATLSTSSGLNGWLGTDVNTSMGSTEKTPAFSIIRATALSGGALPTWYLDLNVVGKWK